MKLTKRKALTICLELWEWLEKNPNSDKYAWPRWVYNDGDLDVMATTCPCCEYSFSHTRYGDCTKCPLLGLWTGEEYSSCMSPKSPYQLNGKAKATGIVKITKLALSKLPKLKGDKS